MKQDFLFFSSPKYPLFTADNQIIYLFDMTFLMKEKKNKSLTLHFLLKIQIICHCYQILYYLNQHAIFIVILTIFWSMYLLALFRWQSSSSVTFLEFQTEQFIPSTGIGYSHSAFQAQGIFHISESPPVTFIFVPLVYLFH